MCLTIANPPPLGRISHQMEYAYGITELSLCVYISDADAAPRYAPVAPAAQNGMPAAQGSRPPQPASRKLVAPAAVKPMRAIPRGTRLSESSEEESNKRKKRLVIAHSGPDSDDSDDSD